MIYIGADPRGQLIPPNVLGSTVTSLGTLPPIFSLSPARIASRMALNVPTGTVGDVVQFLLLPTKYTLQAFMGFDATNDIVSCIIRLRTGPGGTGTIVSTLTASGMAVGDAPKLGTTPVIPMLTEGSLYVRVDDGSSAPGSISLLLTVLDLTPGEITANQWQAQSL